MLRFSRANFGNSNTEAIESFFDQRADEVFSIMIYGRGDDIFARIRLEMGNLSDTFYESDGAIGERFKLCQKLLRDKLGDDIQFLFCYQKEGIVYFKAVGEFRGFLQRGERRTPLFKNKVELLSGKLRDSDNLLLIFDQNKIIDEKLIQTLADSRQDDLDEVLSEKLKDLETVLPLGVVSIRVEEDATGILDTSSVSLIDRVSLIKKISLPIWVKKIRLPSGKRAKIIAGVIAFLLILALWIGLKNYQRVSDENKAFKTLVNNSKAKLNESLSLIESNPDLAKTTYLLAKELSDQVVSSRPKSKESISLQDSIYQASGKIFKTLEIKDWDVFLNLNLIKQDFKASRLSLSLDQLGLLDINQKSLVNIDLANKSPVILAGPEQIGQGELTSINGEKIFTYSEDKGVVEIDINSKKATSVVSADTEWGKVKDLMGFAGNVYLLDSIKNQIWKYVPTENGYIKYLYLEEGTQADFLGAKRMMIDGSLWVLKSGGELLKYTAGVEDYFGFSKIDGTVGNLSSLFISDETKYLYLLDNDNSLVYILQKNGEYFAKLTGEKFKTADDLVVREKEKKLYLLEKNIIYQVELSF